jgi:hypothetical protein
MNKIFLALLMFVCLSVVTSHATSLEQKLDNLAKKLEHIEEEVTKTRNRGEILLKLTHSPVVCATHRYYLDKTQIKYFTDGAEAEKQATEKVLANCKRCRAKECKPLIKDCDVNLECFFSKNK